MDLSDKLQIGVAVGVALRLQLLLGRQPTCVRAMQRHNAETTMCDAQSSFSSYKLWSTQRRRITKTVSRWNRYCSEKRKPQPHSTHIHLDEQLLLTQAVTWLCVCVYEPVRSNGTHFYVSVNCETLWRDGEQQHFRCGTRALLDPRN